MIDRSVLLKRLRALRALAARAGTTHEAHAAASRAAAIVEQYNIDEAELIAAGEMDDEPVSIERRPLVSWARKQVFWQAKLALILSYHHGCHLWREQLMERDGKTVVHVRMAIAGRPTDAAVVRQLFAWLCAETMRLAEQHCPRPMKEAARNAWRVGFISGIRDQLELGKRQARREVAHAVSSTALAIVDHDARHERAMLAVNTKFPTMEQGGPLKGSVSDYWQFESGRAHGQQVHLGKRMGPEKSGG